MVNRKKGGKVEEPTPKSLTDTQPLCPTVFICPLPPHLSSLVCLRINPTPPRHLSHLRHFTATTVKVFKSPFRYESRLHLAILTLVHSKPIWPSLEGIIIIICYYIEWLVGCFSSLAQFCSQGRSDVLLFPF